MFSGCESLLEIPDISKWNTANVEEMNDLFNSGENIEKLSDISKWNTTKVKEFRGLFKN